MNIEVHKYGGSSVANIEKIKSIAKRTIDYQLSAGVKVVLVLSAMADDTDKLYNMAHGVSDKPDLALSDELLATGEQVSCSLMTIALVDMGAEAELVTARKAGIETNDCFGHASIVNVNASYLLTLLKNDIIPVVTGFQGVTLNGQMTTLGRGGSDGSAIALAGALNASCYIYTDVKGVYNVDPNLFVGAELIAKLPAEKMLAMAKLGAKVLHSKAAEQIVKYGVHTWIRPAHNWSVVGTEILVNSTLLPARSFAVVVDPQVVEVRLCLSAEFPSVRSLFKLLADSSFSAEIVGGVSNSDFVGCWRIFVSKDELRWCLDFLSSNSCNYVVGFSYVKVSLFSLVSDLDCQLVNDVYDFLSDLGVDVKNLLTQPDRFTMFFDNQADADKLIKHCFSNVDLL